MGNQPRPKCPKCKSAMTPMFRRRSRSGEMMRAPNAFECREHGFVAKWTESRKAWRMITDDDRDITITAPK